MLNNENKVLSNNIFYVTLINCKDFTVFLFYFISFHFILFYFGMGIEPQPLNLILISQVIHY